MNKIFKALKDPTRRQILKLLRDKDMTAGQIAAHFNISKPSISHHLEILKNADLVTATKQGQFIIYSLNTTVIDEIINFFMDLKTSKPSDNEDLQS